MSCAPVRDILAHQYRPKPNSTLCASQVSYLYQKSISLGFSLPYTHVMIHCNTGFVLHFNILLMQSFRVSSVDVGLVCYCVLYFILSLPHPYQHMQHGVSMLIFNMVSKDDILLLLLLTLRVSNQWLPSLHSLSLQNALSPCPQMTLKHHRQCHLYGQ